MKYLAVRIFLLLLLMTVASSARTRLKDMATIEGVRDNQLIGYGLVVGLGGTGDRQQTVFSTQSLSNLLRTMGVNVAPTALRVRNIAAVMTTANLPAFAAPGTKIDVTVSSIGDAQSLRGGTLLLTSLKAANGEIYAAAQGPLSIGGISAGRGGTGIQVNHPTVGRIPEGAIVERSAPSVAPNPAGFRLQLRNPDFITASRVSKAIEERFPGVAVLAESSAALQIRMPARFHARPVDFIAALDAIEVDTDRRARVVLNERTGTIVIGSNVRIAPVAVLHGSLTVQVVTDYAVSQPPAFSGGQTAVTPQVDVQVIEEEARSALLQAGASVEELIQALTAIGSTPRDIIAIMQSISAAGALEADLELM